MGNIPLYLSTMCPRSSDPFYIVIYYIIWVTTSWTYSMITANMDGAFVYLCLSLIINNVDLDNWICAKVFFIELLNMKQYIYFLYVYTDDITLIIILIYE